MTLGKSMCEYEDDLGNSEGGGFWRASEVGTWRNLNLKGESKQYLTETCES